MHTDNISNQTSIKVPITCVKAPGSLFMSRPLGNPINSKASTDTLLQEFKRKSNFTSDIGDPNCSISSQDQLYILPTLNIEPGKMKQSSDDVAELVSLADRILSFHGINLKIHVRMGYSKSVYNTLKYLVPEICSFPPGFLQKIKISQLNLCEGDDISDQNIAIKETSFSLRSLTTPAQILQRLYQIIFDHVVFESPQIVLEWNEINSKAENYYRAIAPDSLEKVFISVMRNLTGSILKVNDGELKRLLCQYYPEISENWFKERKAAQSKRKNFRFNFLNDP